MKQTHTAQRASIGAKLSTEEVAATFRVDPKTPRASLSRVGHWMGMVPVKLPSGRLLWDGAEVDRLTSGQRQDLISPPRLIAMKYGPDALRHRIGEGDSWSVDQLPSPATFQHYTRHGLYEEDTCRLGGALAESFFKLCRPDPHTIADVDNGATDLALYVEQMPDEMRLGFLGGLEMLLQLALFFPERLPELIKRIDALDNATLQDNATKALCWERVGEDSTSCPMYYGDDGGIFAGLMARELFDDAEGQ